MHRTLHPYTLVASGHSTPTVFFALSVSYHGRHTYISMTVDCLCRLLTVRYASYLDEDGDMHGMRTTVSFLNDEMDGLGINGFSQLGFLLNNGLRVIGPCAVFPRSILQWNVCFMFQPAAVFSYSTHIVFRT